MWVVKLGGSLCASAGTDPRMATHADPHADPRAEPNTHDSLPARTTPAAAATATLRDWLAMLAEAGAGRVVIVPGGGRFADAVREAQAQWRFNDLAAHNMAVLAMAQTAHLLCALHPALQRCDHEADIATALRHGRVAVWSPLELQRDQADADTHWGVTSDSLALGLAQRLGAARLVLVKSCAIDPALTLAQLGERGIVDSEFAARAASAGVQLNIVHQGALEATRSALLAWASGGPGAAERG